MLAIDQLICELDSILPQFFIKDSLIHNLNILFVENLCP